MLSAVVLDLLVERVKKWLKCVHIVISRPVQTLSSGPVRVRIEEPSGVHEPALWPQLEGNVAGFVYAEASSNNSFLINMIALQAEVGSEQGTYK